jgi:hypothetical protein
MYFLNNAVLIRKINFYYITIYSTGSLLVAAAHHGAYVMGMDIDYKLLHGRGKTVCTRY